MGKKIVAFCAGRKYGNTEIFMKEALMAAEDAGCEVELIRLNECDLKPCKACPVQMCAFKGPDACPLKDDGAWLIDKFFDSDGYLLGAPVWALSPTGVVSVFRDRVFGPKMDVASYEIFGGEPEWTKGRGKARPGALISVGGARTEHWTSLGLATLFTTTFSPQTEVVDHMNITEVADLGAAVLEDKLLARAKKLGENLAYAVLHPEEENHWIGDEGDEPAACPGCRQNLMIMKPGRTYVECAICGTRGDISLIDGKIAVDFAPGQEDNRIMPSGKILHMKEIFDVKKNKYEPAKERIPELWKKYKEYDQCIQTPPSGR